MKINSANQQAHADKAAGQSKAREIRETGAAKTDARTDSAAAKQSDRDVFIPSSPAENNGIYKPPSAKQATASGQTEASRQADTDEASGLKPKPQIDELLARIKAATPEELLGAQQKAASENIAALLEAEE